jgi:hypothetical protein
MRFVRGIICRDEENAIEPQRFTGLTRYGQMPVVNRVERSPQYPKTHVLMLDAPS